MTTHSSPGLHALRSVAIVGGGVSGLAAAYRLRELAPTLSVSLFEASSEVGGVVRTERRDRYLVEHGADMFTTREPWAYNLCQRMGFSEQLVGTNLENRRAFIIHRGRLVPVPEGFTLMSPTRVWPLLTTPLLSWGGKLRMASEYFVRRRVNGGDESLADFARRRLGREAYERLVQPLIGGIYTADPESLSMRAALPQFVEMEREHGGLIRGVRASEAVRSQSRDQSGARYGLFLAPRDGMGSLVEHLRSQLPANAIHTQTPVTRAERTVDDRWRLAFQAGPDQVFDGLILATPSHRVAELVERLAPTLADDLRSIPYASAAVVVSGYPRAQIRHALDGFGCVAPLRENRRILSVSFASNKFPGRAPKGHVLLRTFVGGACQPELFELDDRRLREIVTEELTELLGASGSPQFCDVIRWPNAMPQYHLEHESLVSRIKLEVAKLPHLALAGNAYSGVGIPYCVRSGEDAAKQLLEVPCS